MSKIALASNVDGTGTFTIASPDSNSDRTLTLPDNSGTVVVTGSTALTPPGTVIWYAANAAPTGYLKANGAAVSRTTYAALFTAIGTTFGSGDGSTTFLVPDLRGEFARGWDDGRGVDSGRAFGSAQTDGFKSHDHFCSFQSFPNGNPNSKSGFGYNEIELNRSSYGATTNTTGGTETRPRNIALLACIKF